MDNELDGWVKGDFYSQVDELGMTSYLDHWITFIQDAMNDYAPENLYKVFNMYSKNVPKCIYLVSYRNNICNQMYPNEYFDPYTVVYEICEDAIEIMKRVLYMCVSNLYNTRGGVKWELGNESNILYELSDDILVVKYEHSVGVGDAYYQIRTRYLPHSLITKVITDADVQKSAFFKFGHIAMTSPWKNNTS